VRDEKNIDFLKEFIGVDWLDKEFDRVETKSLLKGAGTHIGSYHPYVQYMYELKYLILRADIEKREDVALGRYHFILSNAGTLLRHNFEKIIDKKDAQEKLRNPRQFYDFIWELEVGTMLSLNGADVSYNDPKTNITNDITAVIDNRPLAIECKNKVLDNDKYNTNSIFIQVLSNKLGDVESIKNKIIEFEFDDGRFEDIGMLIAIIRDKFHIFDYQSVAGRYKIRTLKKPFNTLPQVLMGREKVQSVIQINRCLKKELYEERRQNDEVVSKIVFKIPESNSRLKNLNKVLRNANKQLDNGGVVFLHVPFSTFEYAKKEVKKELSLGLSKISAVKLVSYEVEDIENKGVKISRNEELIISERAILKLTEIEVKFLNNTIAFSKFK
jgi:hypothetical protein